MLLYEIFNAPYDWEYTEKDEMFFAAEFRVGDDVRYEVYGQDKGMKYSEWHLGFSRNVPGDPHGEFEITGTGDSQRIFSTVLNILKAFFNEPHEYVHRIYFGAKEPSRRSLYLKLIKKFLPNWKISTEYDVVSAHNPIGPQ